MESVMSWCGGCSNWASNDAATYSKRCMVVGVLVTGDPIAPIIPMVGPSTRASISAHAAALARLAYSAGESPTFSPLPLPTVVRGGPLSKAVFY